MAAKGRQIVKDKNGNGIFNNTIRKKSAEQGILVGQDAMVDAINSLQAALNTYATAMAAAANIAAVNSASTALQTAVAAVAQQTKVSIK